ncbi:hypothetical protein SAMN05216357_102227 [Porphyromonadaceae bacterium KH3CP3RA]|nr:hypothetical protein SAMN05216357_102227 [Porphyromonadaceae bacterium KH3CP3RA]
MNNVNQCASVKKEVRNRYVHIVLEKSAAYL